MLTDKIVKARAPLRIGLAGGGSDVSPYCDTHGGFVLNTTIARYAYAIIKSSYSSEVVLISVDQQSKVKCALTEPFVLNGELNLHKASYNYFMKYFNDNKPIAIELSTFCDAPTGSGLGSSSTVVVVIVKAFIEYLNLSLDDYAIAQLAYTIERIECGYKGGRQDQYSAVFGGFNFMEFQQKNSALIHPLRINNKILLELEACLLLYFTGISRESAKIIEDQSNSLNSDAISPLEAMHGIKREAFIMKEALLRGDFQSFVDSMKRGWEEKKRTSNSVSNSVIDDVYQSALDAGALAGKISGAGGGGFMLFFVPLEARMNLIEKLKEFGGNTSNCHFTNYGAESWKI